MVKFFRSKLALAALCVSMMAAMSVTAMADTVTAEPAAQQTTAEVAKPKFFISATSGRENIAEWQAKNSDVKAWIKVPGTNIDYAVVQGRDNLEYLELGYNKQYSYNGVIWADSGSKFGSRSDLTRNNVIYGHNWTNYAQPLRITNANDVMFAQLPSYHYLNFAQEHPYIYYSTAEEEMIWQVFAVFYVEESFDYISSNPKDAKFANILSEAKARSLHNFDVPVSTNDKILTMSTCTRVYGQRADQRFVVLAKLMPKNAKLTSVTVTENADFKAPVLK